MSAKKPNRSATTSKSRPARTKKTATSKAAATKAATKKPAAKKRAAKKTTAAKAGTTATTERATPERGTSKQAPRKRPGTSRSKVLGASSLRGSTDDDADLDSPPELGIGSRVVPPTMSFPEEEPARPRRARRADADVEAEIRALEARLDGLIHRSAAGDDESLREQVQNVTREVVERLTPPVEVPGGADGGVSAAVKELLSSEYYTRQWGRLGMRSRSEEVDEFGLDPVYESRLRPLLDFLCERYFRVETAGVEKLPAKGRALVVANHSGTVPLDGLVLRSVVRLRHPSARDLRWLAEDFVYYLPFAGAFFTRLGAVRACQENAERLLEGEELVAVFPEGVKGIGKLFRDRYQLQRFGRGGFIRLCLRTHTPIIPCAIVGAEETNPLLMRVEYLSKALGIPYVPVTPTFPWLGPFGLIPAPTKWKIAFADPIPVDSYGPEAAEDHLLVGRLAERVRNAIQELLDQTLAKRSSVWLG
ncbi:MAG: lysophospholipid acyltransferase family protein [Polyangiaceae bacterium]